MMFYALFSVLFTLAAIWSLSRAIRARTNRLKLLKNPVKVKGKVFEVEDVSSDGDAISTYMSHVRYKGADGKTYETKFDVTTEANKYKVGSSVTVLHERGNPANAIDKLRTWDVNLFCVLSFALILISAALAVDHYQIWVLGRDKLTGPASPSSHPLSPSHSRPPAHEAP